LFRGRIKVMSTIALHSTLNISETVRDRGLVPKDHQQEIVYGLSNGHVTDDVTWSQRCCEAVRSAILATAWLLVDYTLPRANFCDASDTHTAGTAGFWR